MDRWECSWCKYREREINCCAFTMLQKIRNGKFTLLFGRPRVRNAQTAGCTCSTISFPRSTNPGAHQMQPPSPLIISWFNLLPRRFIKRTIFFCNVLESHECTCCQLLMTVSSISAWNLLRKPFYLKIYSGKGWHQGLVWEMKTPSDRLLTIHSGWWNKIINFHWNFQFISQRIC